MINGMPIGESIGLPCPAKCEDGVDCADAFTARVLIGDCVDWISERCHFCGYEPTTEERWEMGEKAWEQAHDRNWR